MNWKVLTTSDKLLGVVTAALIVWAVQHVITYYIERDRLETGIITEINEAVSSVKETTEFADAMLKTTIKRCSVVSFGANYYMSEFGYYDAIIRDLPSYLTKSEMSKTMRFYIALKEYDAVADSFFRRLTQLEEKQVPLTELQVRLFESLVERLGSLTSVLASKQYFSLDELPDDYRGRSAPKVQVPKSLPTPQPCP